jgi:hypothetical protein
MIKKLCVILLILCLSVPCFAKARWYNATATIGSADGALDTINGQNLIDGDRAIVLTATQVYFYYLDDDSGAAESDPDTVSPDSNAGDKRWILIQSIVP